VEKLSLDQQKRRKRKIVRDQIEERSSNEFDTSAGSRRKEKKEGLGIVLEKKISGRKGFTSSPQGRRLTSIREGFWRRSRKGENPIS